MFTNLLFLIIEALNVKQVTFYGKRKKNFQTKKFSAKGYIVL